MKPSPSQTIGPFFRFGLDWLGSVAADRTATGLEEGLTVEIRGTVSDSIGPVPDALIEFVSPQGFSRTLVDADGTYRVAAQRPARGYFDVSVFARGLLQRLVTRCYLDRETAEADQDVYTRVPVERRGTLVGRTDGDIRVFDLVLHGPGETVFFVY